MADDDAALGDGCEVCRRPVIAEHICQRCRETLINAEQAYKRLDSYPVPD